jgi:hypothetical protein
MWTEIAVGFWVWVWLGARTSVRGYKLSASNAFIYRPLPHQKPCCNLYRHFCFSMKFRFTDQNFVPRVHWLIYNFWRRKIIVLCHFNFNVFVTRQYHVLYYCVYLLFNCQWEMRFYFYLPKIPFCLNCLLKMRFRELFYNKYSKQ